MGKRRAVTGAGAIMEQVASERSKRATCSTWSDPTMPRLRPLQLLALAHTYMYTMDFITMHAATRFVGWAYFQVINDPLQ